MKQFLQKLGLPKIYLMILLIGLASTTAKSQTVATVNGSASDVGQCDGTFTVSVFITGLSMVDGTAYDLYWNGSYFGNFVSGGGTAAVSRNQTFFTTAANSQFGICLLGAGTPVYTGPSFNFGNGVLPTAGTITGTSTVCQGASTTLTANPSGGSGTFSSYTWSSSDVTKGTVSGTASTTSLVGVGGGSTDITYTVTDDRNCTSTSSAPLSVTVSAAPTATVTGGTTVCADASSPNITFTGASGTSPYTFAYKINGGTTQTATTVSGSSINVSAPTNISGSFVYQLVSVTESSLNACTNLQSGSDIIIVDPSPDVTQPANLNIITGASSGAINFSGSVVGTKFDWTNNTPGIGLAASGSGNIASFIGTNSTSSPLTATVTVTPYTSSTVNLIANGGFESGSLSSWTNTGFGASGNCGGTNQDWKVSNDGSTGTGCSNPGNPTSGSYAAYSMFDAGSALTYRMYQTITLPATITTVDLGYLYAYTANFSGLPRIFSVNIYDAANTTKLATLDNVTVTGSGSASWTTKNVNVASLLAPYAGQTVIFDLSAQIQQAWSGPSGFGVDDVSLNFESVNCTGTSKTFNITVANPIITTSGTLSAFTSCAGTASAQQNFTVSGTGLSADILVTPPTGYEVSTTSGSGFASSVTLTQSGGIVNNTIIYVRLTNAATGTPSGNVACTSTGATTQNVAASGTVNTNPTASFTINDFDQCLDGNSFTVNSTSTHGSGTSFTYAWTATGASPALTAVAGPPAFSYATRGLKTVNLTVTDNHGCSNATTVTNNITVWGNPVASFTINDNTQCLIGNSFTLTNTSTNSLDGAINAWAWATATGTPTSFNVVGPNVVNYAAFGDKTVNLTVTDVNGCTNATTFTNNIAVYGHPTAAFVTTESSATVNDFNICTGSVVNFTGASSTAGAYPGSTLNTGLAGFQYRSTNLILPGPPAPANAGPGSNASVYAPVVNGTNGPVNDDFLYSLIVTNNWGCTDTTSGVNSRHIYVYPFPVTSITTPVVGTQGQYGVPANNGNGGQLLCHSKVVFGNTSTTPNGSIASYIWNYGDGSPSDVVTTADNVKHEFPVNYNINWFDAAFPNTRYTISLTAVTSQGCSTSTTTTRDIKNGPDAVIGLDNPTTQSLVGNSYLFRNLSQNRHPSFIDSSLWNWGDGTGTSNTTFIPKVYASAGNYRVHLITYTGTGCTDTAHIDLTVNAATASNFTVTPNTCGSKVVGFTSTSTGATTYSWNFGDGNTSTLANPSHTYAADGSYIVTLTINGGIASAPQTVHVVSNPVVGPIVNAGPSACGNTYTFSNVSTGVNLSYAWTFGGAASTGTTSTTASANRSYSAAGTATVDLVVSADGRCPVSATQISFTSVVGGGSPAAGVTIAAASVPAASSRSVNNTSTNASLYYVSVDGAAFVAKTVFPYDITGLTDGLHTVRLVASDLLGTCKDTATASFTVTLTPCIAVAGINTTPATTQTLATNKFDFFNTTVVNGFGWISANSWDFGDGTTSTNTHIYGKTYAAAGTYTVTLVATMSPGGCTSIATQVVTVTAATAANFTVTPNTCGSKVVGFTSTSTGATTYSWNFGDGSPAVTTANPNHTYASDGSYTVTLTINGSVVSTPQTVHVVSNPVVGPIVNAGPSACGNTYTFSNVSTGVNLSYAWTFGGAASTGSTSTTASANRSYSVAGAATVDLVVSADGRCPVSATQISFTSVVGGGSPVAGVTIAAASVPAATSKSVNNTSTNATLYAVSIDGGAFTAQTVFPYDITGLSNGAHTVRLVAAATGWTCKDTATASFTVTTTTCVAVAGFNVTPSSSQPLGTNKFDFFNTTQHNGFGWITDYDWDFGDGTQDLTNTFVYGKTYASVGTYTVTLTAVSSTGCTSTYSSTVTVTPSASASFTYTPNTCGSLAIAFNSSGSVSASSYLWNFGDGNTSTSANPTHTYAAAGSYTVTLTINGTTTSAPQTVVVAATPTAATITPTVSSCGNVYTYTGSATGSGITYTWAFSNLTGTGATTGAAVTRTYSAAGTDNVTLTATSGACSATATLSGHAVLQVGAIIDANLSITAANGCNGTRTVNHTSTGATSYEVSVDGGAYVVKTVFPYDITGLAAGAHTVALKAINGLCSDIETVSFNVGSVTAAFTATPGSCNSTVAFTNTTTTTFGTPTYAWTFPTGTPSTSTATSPSTDYGSSGTKSATLVATLDNGCSTSVTNSAIAVVGSGGPVASFTSSMIVGGGCNTGVQFTSTSTGATTYTWNYGDGTVSVNSSNPTIFHAYSSVGTYNVTLTASNGTCSSTSATTPVVVTATGNAVPEAAFNIINRPAVQCITGNRYDFFNTTQLNGWGWVPTYSWDFGDGTTSTATMAYGKTYATAGTYTVTLTAVSNLGCSATATMDVTVNGLPCAGMIAGTTPGNYDGPNTYGAATTVASGVEESADISNKVGLYPNPTTGNFRLTLENVKGNKATITIVDMLGREVYQHNYNILGAEQIDINDLNLAEGKYNLVLQSSSDQVARKSFAVIK